MKPQKLLVLVIGHLIGALLLTSCQDSSQGKQPSQEVIDTFLEFVEAYKNLESRKALSFFSTEDGFMMLQTHQLSGTEINDYFISSMQQTSTFDSVSFSNTKVQMLSDQIAVLRCNFFEQYTLKSGESQRFNGAGLYVFKKFSNQWKIVHSAGAVAN